MKRFLTTATLALSAFVIPTVAASCESNYTIRSGDSLTLIADQQYQDVGMWTAIYSANASAIGENPDSLRVGAQLRLDCIGGHSTDAPADAAVTQASAVATSPASVVRSGRKLEQTINLVTAGDFAPFTDQGLENEGLITEVVNAAMAASQGDTPYKVHWVNDWSSHLDPLMSNAMMDMAFPWYKPDCAGAPDHFRCANFHFSDPMFEILILLFVDKTRPMVFSSDADVEGRTLCRPAGYFTHDLDRADRRWLSDGKITLTRPVTVKECFDLLTNGEVDAVALNEFTGRAAINDLNLKDRVEIVQGRPVSIEGLHVLVHKEHPSSADMIATINDGLAAIKESGEYQHCLLYTSPSPRDRG